jgi:hypothetical protein
MLHHITASAPKTPGGRSVKIAVLLLSLLVALPALADEPAKAGAFDVDAPKASSTEGVATLPPEPTRSLPPLPQEETKSEGLLPGILFGPKLSVLTLPTPAVGVEVKAYQLFGASFDYGFIPDFTVSGVTLGMQTWNVGAKVYPSRGAFFLGAKLGSYTFSGKSTLNVNGQPAQAKLEVSATFLAPEIGWRWVWASGFFTGLDLGWQFPLNYRSTLDVPAGVSPGTIKDVHDNVDKYVKSGIPALGLLQLGWFF